MSWGFDYTPDCVKRQPLVQVNGVWPPPTLVVKAGEQVTLDLTNELIAVAFTVHLHGFDQLGTPWADGTGMITTCPIPPDTSSSVQVFRAPPQPGTYIYHGHVGHAKGKVKTLNALLMIRGGRGYILHAFSCVLIDIKFPVSRVCSLWIPTLTCESPFL